MTRTILRLHNVLGLVIGAQFLFWVASGLFFTLFPIETIRGEHYRLDQADTTLDPANVTIGISALQERLGEGLTEATLTTIADVTTWRVTTQSHRILLIDAETGVIVSPLSLDMANTIYVHGIDPAIGEVSSICKLENAAPREYGGSLPVWVFEHEQGRRRVYIDAMSGQIRAIRTTNWRVFDVLWRFHIMDVTGDDRFDSWWLKLSAVLGLTMVLTGIVLVIRRILIGRLLV